MNFITNFKNFLNRVFLKIIKLLNVIFTYLLFLIFQNGRKMNSKEAKDDEKLKQLLGTDTTYSDYSNAPRWRRQKKQSSELP